MEKAQHEPHWPWFFTGVTAPLVDPVDSVVVDSRECLVVLGAGIVRVVLEAADVLSLELLPREVRALWPTYERPLPLCSAMIASLAKNAAFAAFLPAEP